MDEKNHNDRTHQQKTPRGALEEQIASLEQQIASLGQQVGQLSDAISLLIAQDQTAKNRKEEKSRLRKSEMRAKGMRLAAILYLALAALCILIIVRPGAKLFYFKQALDKESIVSSEQGAHRYPLELNSRVSPVDGILLEEDDHWLERSGRATRNKLPKGSYSLGDLNAQEAYIYFNPTDGSDPRTNDSQYIIYYPSVFFSSQMGVLYLVVLVVGLALYLFLTLRKPEKRQKLLPAFKALWAEIAVNQGHWERLFTFTVLAAYLLAFMEWLFLVTMPSFMDTMQVGEKLAILLLAGLLIAVHCVLALLAVMVIDILLAYFKLTRRFVYAGVLVPAGILGCLALLLIDNFTYTLFKFGVVSTAGAWRGVYALVFICLLAYIYVSILPHTGLASKTTKSWLASPRLFYVACALLLVSAGIVAANREKPAGLANTAAVDGAERNSPRPHILLLGADGANARNLSLYGYARDTTPRLLALAETSLVAENAFPNSTQTTGSIVSIFTSRLPTETRVIYAPDILKGEDAFRHLPGILRDEGYRSIQLGLTNYIDAKAVNLHNGFDRVNGETIEDSVFPLFIDEPGFGNGAYLMTLLTTRLGDRLRHIFYLQEMNNPFDEVAGEAINKAYLRDQIKVNEIIDVLTDSHQPVFVHAHLMVTHGPDFYFRQPNFSTGKEQSEPWMTDFYDDAIYDFDKSVGKILDALDKAGVLDNTMIIIYSDHGMKYTVQRLPLLFHFPKDENSEKIQAAVQNLDIAPTILDYLGLEIPEWMAGQSLLSGKLPPDRLIFTVSNRPDILKSTALGVSIIDSQRIGPPFYQFGAITVTQCQRWHRLDLITLTWQSGDYGKHTSPCPEAGLYSLEQIQQAVAEHLAGDGFDISTLPK